MDGRRKQEVKVFRNGAESLIMEFLKGKDVDWCRSAIWMILINPCKSSSIKEAKAVKWLEKTMRKGQFKTVEDLMIILNIFTDLIDKETKE